MTLRRKVPMINGKSGPVYDPDFPLKLITAAS
jgi:hypothetical protein